MYPSTADRMVSSEFRFEVENLEKTLARREDLQDLLNLSDPFSGNAILFSSSSCIFCAIHLGFGGLSFSWTLSDI